MNDNHPQNFNNNSNSQSPRSYRPRSPDLSGFAVPPPPHLGRIQSLPERDADYPQGYSISHRGSYDASPYFSPQSTQPTSYFGTALHSQPPESYPHQTQSLPQQSYSQHTQSYSHDTYLQQQFQDMARLRTRPQVNYNDDAHQSDEFDQQYSIPPQQQVSQPPSRIPPMPQQIMTAQQPMPMTMMQSPFQQQPAQLLQSTPQATQPPIEIRTKFPVARIKRIMQADEDIGKVAQATPTAVAKALELFMIALVTKSASDAKSHNSRRVTATHLKTALMGDPMFDFLKDTCENAAEEGAKRERKGKIEGGSEGSEDEDIGGVPAAKKGGRKAGGASGAGGKRKKASTSVGAESE